MKLRDPSVPVGREIMRTLLTLALIMVLAVTVVATAGYWQKLQTVGNWIIFILVPVVILGALAYVYWLAWSINHSLPPDHPRKSPGSRPNDGNGSAPVPARIPRDPTTPRFAAAAAELPTEAEQSADGNRPSATQSPEKH